MNTYDLNKSVMSGVAYGLLKAWMNERPLVDRNSLMDAALMTAAAAGARGYIGNMVEDRVADYLPSVRQFVRPALAVAAVDWITNGFDSFENKTNDKDALKRFGPAVAAYYAPDFIPSMPAYNSPSGKPTIDSQGLRGNVSLI